MIPQVLRWFKGHDPVACPPASVPTLPLVHPPLDQLARQPECLPARVADDAVGRKYLTLLGNLPWSTFPERAARRANGAPWPGPWPVARAPFVAAYLVKLHEQHASMGQLHQYLVEHPVLVWLLGFELVADPTSLWGFDVERSVPSRRQLNRVLRTLPNEALQFLLDASVDLIRAALPAAEQATFGDVVSGDTKAILAWVRENNPKAFIEEGRFDKTRQPKGDPDCKLGVKKKRNRSPDHEASAPPATPTAEGAPASTLQIGSDILWGYASGVIATKVGDWAEVVLAERTRPFNESDISYFLPLMAQVERRLGVQPRFGTFDAAYDAHYIHAYFAGRGGFAAVPWADAHPAPVFDAQRRPLCPAGLAMVQKFTYQDRTSSAVPRTRAQCRCPLLFPAPTGECCPIAHRKWDEGGCVKSIGVGPGEYERYTLDRKSDDYQRIFDQRTADERINALAKALGIERPHLRNQRSITNHNTLIYLLLNLRAAQRIRARRQAEPSPARLEVAPRRVS